jgi:hemoglobin-like flavoprotein
MSSVDDIIQSNPALVDKDTGMINAEEYKKILNSNPQINQVFSSMENE